MDAQRHTVERTPSGTLAIIDTVLRDQGTADTWRDWVVAIIPRDERTEQAEAIRTFMEGQAA